jgi:hypothetical protein
MIKMRNFDFENGSTGWKFVYKLRCFAEALQFFVVLKNQDLKFGYF